jgi:threonine/homoserine/homoserine lactone efflux protein
VLGGGFILFLARNAYLTFKRTETTSDLVPDSAAQSFFKAAVINILNPNPYIFWSVISGPILLDGWRESPIFGISFIASFYGMLIGCLVVLVLLFGIARSSGPVVVRVLIGISALALLVFGVYQIISGVAGFVG